MPNNNLRTQYPEIVESYKNNLETFVWFQKCIVGFFESHSLSNVVHSVRHRIKSLDHFLEKVDRKNKEDMKLDLEMQRGAITADNLFERITDFSGVRVLHLYSSQIKTIHEALQDQVDKNEFIFVEQPKAYTWDPESNRYFEDLGIIPKLKDSYYTSIHYVLQRNSDGPATCEVQVRTLLEEVWGEIDHTMNYPYRTQDEHCREQIRILARLVGAGTHLADSIMRHYGEST